MKKVGINLMVYKNERDLVMKNIKYSAAALSVFICMLFLFSVNLFAEDQIYVYINSEPLIYADATPQIMNNRAMVPFRLTAEKLGANVDWNSKTETMTLTKGTRTVVHQLRSNVVTINGEAVVFDTPSAVLKDRTMMPVRMLAEALGCNVDWDNATRSVIIKTEAPEVIQASFNSNVIVSGSEAILTVNTNTMSEKVKAVDVATQNIIAESFNYTTNPDGTRTFAIKWSPTTQASVYKPIEVYAGDSASYSTTGTVTTGLNITVDNTPKIATVKADKTSVKKNDYVTVTVRTNKAADRIKIVNDFKSGADEYSTFTESNSGEQREFTGKVRMTVKGECTLQVYAGNADGYDTSYQTLAIDVDRKANNDDDDDDDDDSLRIISVDVLNDSVAVDEEATVNIETSTDITRVVIYNESDREVAKKNFHTSKTSGHLVWKMTFDVTKSGRNKYTVYAYDDDDDYDSQTFNITGETYSSSGVHVIGITAKNDEIAYGDTVRFVAKTTASVDHIVVKDYVGNEIAEITEPKSANSSYCTFEFSYKVDSRKAEYITVYAYDKDGNSDSKRFYLSLEETEGPDIIEVEINSKTVDEGDDIELTVYTNSAVTRVWIEDDNGTRKVNKKKYDSKKNDEYTWEISFEAEEEGRHTYTVYAENDSDEEDEYSFTIKVK